MVCGVNLLLFLLVQALFASVSFSAHEIRLRCSDTPVTFVFDHAEEMRCLCATTSAAIHFLKSIGLETTENITIRVVEKIPDQKHVELFGAYDPETREVFILSFSKLDELAQKNKIFLGQALSEDLWCSFAAHELAHAVSSQYILPDIKNKTPGEYISAVTQLSVLKSENRAKILKNYREVDAYKSMNEISILYYLLAPNEFVVKCYLHFMSLDNPRKFIERLLVTKDEFWDTR